MNKNVRLNQKAFAQVVDDLMRSGFIRLSVVKDHADGRVSRVTTLTKNGTKLVATCADALVTIRNPTKRKIEAFGHLMTLQALEYLRQTGRIID